MSKFKVGTGGESIILSTIALSIVVAIRLFEGKWAWSVWFFVVCLIWWLGSLLSAASYTEVSDSGITIKWLFGSQFYAYEDIKVIYVYREYILVYVEGRKPYFYDNYMLNVKDMLYECKIRGVDIRNREFEHNSIKITGGTGF